MRSLDEIRSEIRKIGVAEFARRSGIAKTTLYGFMDRKEGGLHTKTQATIEQVLDQMIGEKRINPSQAEHQQAFEFGNETFLAIPVHGVKASAGPGTAAFDGPPVGHIFFTKPFISSLPVQFNDLVAIKIEGDSMSPTLRDGDQILVDRGVDVVKSDAIYVIRVNDDLYVKRCQLDITTGELVVTSDNPDYQSFRLPADHDLTIIGRVIWTSRRI